MEKSGFYKVYVETAENRIVRFRNGQCVVFYGHGTDEHGRHYTWRQNYPAPPSVSEIRADIDALVNRLTAEAIRTGYEWEGKPVWLSTENQMNFKAAHDLARDTDGATLPVTFKLGEAEDGAPVYHTFSDAAELTAFHAGAVAHINACLAEGWRAKDEVDYSVYG